ncbi:hydroxylysine kinase [Topomyia yanbarensis]|uniref:hydroxylysine kinase n=1 Tax=Topomyia yanbarensis TaxID=2498891 RepID=UPI00273A7E7E|nr:hydroxylysine kinase [Topomyia yanbarensis]XP_058812416.1 hydroxylysine kinase [Topomyia yanbarensis]
MEMKMIPPKKRLSVEAFAPSIDDSNGRTGSGESDAVTLKPGSKIRPIVTEEDVRKLAERLYGIIILEMCELDSYDDKNYLIQADRLIKNPILKTVSPNGYVLKIANSLDSQNELFFEGQTEVMHRLVSHQIRCPLPIRNIFGKFHSLEKLGQSKHVVRLLEYIPGKVFHGVPHPERLFYQAGMFIARVDAALKGIKHEGVLQRESVWKLDNFLKLEEFLYVIKDEHRKDIVEQVLVAFQKRIVANSEELERGVIYGDFNEHNIIVNRMDDNPKEYDIAGIIDFGDICYSYYVFELAIAMTYMMLESNDLDTGGLIMAGYGMLRLIPPHEKAILKVAIAARLCQSLVLGLYTSTVDENNQYILSTQTRGWGLLEALWAEKEKDLLERWEKVAVQFLTRSPK